MLIRAITFDLDNTLWDVEAPLRRAEAAQRVWLDTHRPKVTQLVDSATVAEIRHVLFSERPEIRHNVTALRREFIRRIQLHAGYSEDDAQEGIDGAFGEFLLARQEVELYSDVVETLRTLAKDYVLGALTNGNADVYKTAAGEFMDFAFLAEDVGASKPAPALFEAAMVQTKLPPEQILHVGDNPEHDIDGALAAGFHTAWINPKNESWSRSGAPHLNLRHVSELPAAIKSLSNSDTD